MPGDAHGGVVHSKGRNVDVPQHGHARMIRQVSPHPRIVDDDVEVARLQAFGPPYSGVIKIFGDAMAPALTITSWSALAIIRLPPRVYSTPTARVPSKRIRSTRAPVTTLRLRRRHADPR